MRLAYRWRSGLFAARSEGGSGLNRDRIRIRGFTLVELLVVIAIIGMLVALLIPAVQAARGAARRTACSNNLKQVGLAVLNYESAWSRFPPGQRWTALANQPDRGDYSWMALILPHVEAGPTYDQFNFKLPFLHPTNRVPSAYLVETYLCPSTTRRDKQRGGDDLIRDWKGQVGVTLACTDYMGIAGPTSTRKNPATQERYKRQQGILVGTKGLEKEDRLLEAPPVKMASVTDGTSKTFMITECTGRGTEKEDEDPNGAWVSGKNITHLNTGVNRSGAKSSWNDELIFSEHAGGANAAFVDGSVRFLLNGTSKDVILAQASRNGGEIIPELEE